MSVGDFDTRAETWDDANKVARAAAVAAAIRRAVPFTIHYWTNSSLE